ncbi:unnamed protein product [Ceutorhynchus assimilis]|uniref:Lysosomal Pro-X carboxypeptidase n=1 Tax=Ceutorhynchus assimilis TaxID=467358 RepID=A0A9N9QQN9_9CUCU|nr:unnamed protein product [Ceutorhynchus assimilis]
MFFLLFILILISHAIAITKYEESYLEVPIDHFSLSKTNDTFKLRYLLVEQFHIKGGPIFLYCGNEADIKVFYDNSGFLLDIAPTFNALVVFVEHRYYGQSMPFGPKSLNSAEGLRYLTVEQALADFACVIDSLIKKYFSTMITNISYPIVAFGGSYGGMLAAWLRIKYPHLILGAVASSAPLLQLNNLKLCENFYHIVTQSYRNENCSQAIKASWEAIRNITKTHEGKKNVGHIFKLCKTLGNEDDVGKFIDSLEEIYVNLAMLNYPYATSFLAPLPGNPVKSFCDKLKSYGTIQTPLALLQAISSALEIATNYSGTTKCNNIEITNNEPTDFAWGFQACFELIIPMCSTKEDIFEPISWDYEKFTKECIKKYGVVPYSPNKLFLEFGGATMLKYSSNIVFSNGLLDPWSSGGVLANISDSVVAVLIPEAAHHYDLRGANPVDSKYVLDARKFHVAQIRKWLNIS